MNSYIRALFVIPCGAVKMSFIKLFHMRAFHGPIISMLSPFTEISLDYGGQLSIGKRFKMRDGAKIRVRKGAKCNIGDYTSVSTNNIIACHESISIGDNVQLSPGVLIYDHDHDFRHPDGLKANYFKTAPVSIGNNCWIGANTVILRGTTIGDNCVIGASCVIKGNVPEGTIYIQQRVDSKKCIDISMEKDNL